MTRSYTQQRVWVAPTLTLISAVWCVVMGFVIWYTPLRYLRCSGVNQYVAHDVAFRDVSGLGALPLIVPMALAILATSAAWRRNRVGLGVSALLFAGFTFIAGFTIGGHYLAPAGLLMLAFAVSLAWRTMPRVS